MQSYTDLFAQRGSAYDIAMRRHPRARDAEFQQAVRAGALEPGMLVGDVPAGGGYLARYLPQGCACLEHEPCASFADHEAALASLDNVADAGAIPHHGGQGGALLPLPWGPGLVDALISLAGVHHMQDKRPLFAEMRRVTRQGGRLVLSDVAEGSAPADFLDGFVGAHNSTGHEGAFLSQHTLEELAETGWSVLTARLERFHWAFPSRAAMADFCRWLFDIRTAGEVDILAAIERDLGLDDLPDGRIGMRWSLFTITAENGQ